MYLVVTNLKSLLLYTTPLGFLKIEVELIYNVALVFAVQQSDSAYIYIYMYINLYPYSAFILFCYGLSQNVDYSCLCYTAGPCCSPILYVIVFIC